MAQTWLRIFKTFHHPTIRPPTAITVVIFFYLFLYFFSINYDGYVDCLYTLFNHWNRFAIATNKARVLN